MPKRKTKAAAPAPAPASNLLTPRPPKPAPEDRPPTLSGLARVVADLNGDTVRAIGPGAPSVAYEARQRGIEVVEGEADHLIAIGTLEVPPGSWRKTCTVCVEGSQLSTRQRIRARFGRAHYLCQIGSMSAWRVTG